MRATACTPFVLLPASHPEPVQEIGSTQEREKGILCVLSLHPSVHCTCSSIKLPRNGSLQFFQVHCKDTPEGERQAPWGSKVLTHPLAVLLTLTYY